MLIYPFLIVFLWDKEHFHDETDEGSLKTVFKVRFKYFRADVRMSATWIDLHQPHTR